jgi:hypothetical protein
LETPLFFSAFGDGDILFTANFDFFLSPNHKSLMSFGYGRLFFMEDWNYSDMVLTSGFTGLVGEKNHYLEVGGNLAYLVGDIMVSFRFGYRGVFWKRILARVAYTPGFLFFSGNDIIGPIDHTLSVSIGYRFGKDISKQVWDTKYRWLSNLQLDWQFSLSPDNVNGGVYRSFSLEFLIMGFEKLSLMSWLGYVNGDYGLTDYPVEGLPFGFRANFGKKKHFLESGIGFAWFPLNGNLSGNFYKLQLEVGGRINLGKRFLIRLAYTPYWWLADNEGREHIEPGFVNSISLGIGYRFH